MRAPEKSILPSMVCFPNAAEEVGLRAQLPGTWMDPEPQERGDPGPSLIHRHSAKLGMQGESHGLWLDIQAGFWGQGQLKASNVISGVAQGLNCSLTCLSLPAG